MALRGFKTLFTRSREMIDLSNRENKIKLREYVEYLEFFDEWPSEKFLIHFEELISDPFLTIHNLSGFWGS
jgi:hypothetical protein